MFKSVLALLALAATANAGTFKTNQAFDGSNPSNVGYNVYEPTTVKTNAPLVVYAHWCSGSAQAAYSGNGLNSLADQLGFPVIYPDSPNSGKCWDVGSAATLKHNGGGDSLGIVSMVKYAIKKYGSDPNRVFITGLSSGAMMTQVLAGAYPDVFAAGAEYAGVPFACWANGGVAQWNSNCANGQVSKTGAAWAQLVKDAYPGYSGHRPKLQLYHGTADSTINYNNFKESIKQWTAVFGVSETPAQTVSNTPQSGWTKTVYGSGQLEAFSASGVGHSISYQLGTVSTFFDLACAPGGANCYSMNSGGSTTTTPTTTSTTTTATPGTTPTVTTTTAPSTTATTGGAAKWGQCGGNGWTGPTTCKEGTCTKLNDWYSQCL